MDDQSIPGADQRQRQLKQLQLQQQRRQSLPAGPPSSHIQQTPQQLLYSLGLAGGGSGDNLSGKLLSSLGSDPYANNAAALGNFSPSDSFMATLPQTANPGSRLGSIEEATGFGAFNTDPMNDMQLPGSRRHSVVMTDAPIMSHSPQNLSMPPPTSNPVDMTELDPHMPSDQNANFSVGLDFDFGHLDTTMSPITAIPPASHPVLSSPEVADAANSGTNLTALTGNNSSSGSTLTEFTKRRNWSQRIIEELQDFLHILTPNGKIRYASPNCKSLTGYAPEQLVGRLITDFVHTDDSHLFIREFNESIATGHQLRLFYRFKKMDSSYVILETDGHPHFADAPQLPTIATAPICSGFFMMARQYPTKNAALLDSFLEHKIENERLLKRISELRQEESEEFAKSRADESNNGDTNSVKSGGQIPRTLSTPGGSAFGQGSDGASIANQLASQSMPPPAKPSQGSSALTRQNLDSLDASSALNGDSLREKMARFEGASHVETIEMLTGLRYREGERSRGISTGDTSPSLIRGDAGVPMPIDKDNRSSGERKKKPKVANEYVCTDCGTLESPEWRKGPTGPKTLCNACGLRWAKKEKKRNSISNTASSIPATAAPPMPSMPPHVPSMKGMGGLPGGGMGT